MTQNRPDLFIKIPPEQLANDELKQFEISRVLSVHQSAGNEVKRMSDFTLNKKVLTLDGEELSLYYNPSSPEKTEFIMSSYSKVQSPKQMIEKAEKYRSQGMKLVLDSGLVVTPIKMMGVSFYVDEGNVAHPVDEQAERFVILELADNRYSKKYGVEKKLERLQGIFGFSNTASAFKKLVELYERSTLTGWKKFAQQANVNILDKKEFNQIKEYLNNHQPQLQEA